MKIKSIVSSSAGNCHIVEHKAGRLMLDAGISKSQLRSKRVKLSDLSGCLITHAHMDHAKGARDLLRASVDVYLSKDTDKALELPRSHRKHVVGPLGYFTVGGFKVAAFEGHHDIPVLGFYVTAGDEKLVYITDTCYVDYKFPGMTHLIVECSYDADSLEASGKDNPGLVKRVIQTHLGEENVHKLLEDNDLSKLKEVRLVHLSDANADQEAIAGRVRKLLKDHVVLTIANKGGGVTTYE